MIKNSITLQTVINARIILNSSVYRVCITNICINNVKGVCDA